jgi:hypothetical protein
MKLGDCREELLSWVDLMKYALLDFDFDGYLLQ